MDKTELTTLLTDRELFPSLSEKGVPILTTNEQDEGRITIDKLNSILEKEKYTLDPETMNITL